MMDNVRFLIDEGYPVGEDIKNILMRMSEAQGVVKPVVALPDVHFKSSYHTPTGVVVLTKDTIVPKFINANCGMSFVKTPFLSGDIDDKKLDLIFGYLRDNISVSTRLAPVISHKDLREIIRQGAAWAVNRYGMDPADLINFENNGSLLKGDLRENAEYDAAKDAQAMNEKRVAELEEKLANGRIINNDDMTVEEVLIGATVQVKDLDTDELLEYMLVSEAEADYNEGKISVTSPIGSALLNHKEKEVVEIKVPAGILRYEILKISR